MVRRRPIIRPPMVRYTCRPGEEPPRIDEWLKSDRGRNSYHVVGVKAGRVGIGGARIYVLRLERFAADKIPEGATVRRFAWLARNKRR